VHTTSISAGSGAQSIFNIIAAAGSANTDSRGCLTAWISERGHRCGPKVPESAHLWLGHVPPLLLFNFSSHFKATQTLWHANPCGCLCSEETIAYSIFWYKRGHCLLHEFHNIFMCHPCNIAKSAAKCRGNVGNFCDIVALYRVGHKKRATLLLSISLPIIDRFSKFFHCTFCGQLAIEWLLNVSSHANYVTTLPYEIEIFKNH